MKRGRKGGAEEEERMKTKRSRRNRKRKRRMRRKYEVEERIAGTPLEHGKANCFIVRAGRKRLKITTTPAPAGIHVPTLSGGRRERKSRGPATTEVKSKVGGIR